MSGDKLIELLLFEMYIGNYFRRAIGLRIRDIFSIKFRSSYFNLASIGLTADERNVTVSFMRKILKFCGFLFAVLFKLYFMVFKSINLHTISERSSLMTV